MLRVAPVACAATLALCSPAAAVDCERWPAHAQCLPQQAQPAQMRRAKVVRKIESSRRKAGQVRRGGGKAPFAVPPKTGGSEPAVTQVSRPAETLLYRQIEPRPVVTTVEPRIVPLPSRMPDLSSRTTFRIEAPQIAAPNFGWSRSRDGKIAIMCLVAAFTIGSVAYVLDRQPQGKRRHAESDRRA